MYFLIEQEPIFMVKSIMKKKESILEPCVEECNEFKRELFYDNCRRKK